MIKLTNDKSWYCEYCNTNSAYKIEVKEDNSNSIEDIYLCNKHLEELKSKLMK